MMMLFTSTTQLKRLTNLLLSVYLYSTRLGDHFVR